MSSKLLMIFLVLLIHIPTIQGRIDKDGVEHYTYQAPEKEGLSCYALGYLYARTAMRNLLNIPTNPEYDDLTIPKRCRGKVETTAGMNDGIRSVVILIEPLKKGGKK